jgi:hypothetical protein
LRGLGPGRSLLGDGLEQRVGLLLLLLLFLLLLIAVLLHLLVVVRRPLPSARRNLVLRG